MGAAAARATTSLSVGEGRQGGGSSSCSFPLLQLRIPLCPHFSLRPPWLSQHQRNQLRHPRGLSRLPTSPTSSRPSRSSETSLQQRPTLSLNLPLSLVSTPASSHRPPNPARPSHSPLVSFSTPLLLSCQLSPFRPTTQLNADPLNSLSPAPSTPGLRSPVLPPQTRSLPRLSPHHLPAEPPLLPKDEPRDWSSKDRRPSEPLRGLTQLLPPRRRSRRRRGG